MGRRKIISDTALLDALLATLQETGPNALSFAKGSQAAGLSPATLVQRFGTRDVMIEAVLLHAWDHLDAATEAADAEAPCSPAGAVSLLMRLTPPGAAEFDMTDGLLLLREDMRNPALRARGRAWGAALAKALGRRLTADEEAAERLGWQMASMWQGALIWQAFTHGTDAEIGIEAMLDMWCRSEDSL